MLPLIPDKKTHIVLPLLISDGHVRSIDSLLLFYCKDKIDCQESPVLDSASRTPHYCFNQAFSRDLIGGGIKKR